MLRLIKFKNDVVKIVKAEGDFKTSKNYFILSRARRQLRLSIFSLRNNIESSQLKIKCDDVLVLAKFLLSTAFSTAMSSAGEARLTDKILKGFFALRKDCSLSLPLFKF